MFLFCVFYVAFSIEIGSTRCICVTIEKKKKRDRTIENAADERKSYELFFVEYLTSPFLEALEFLTLSASSNLLFEDIDLKVHRERKK